MSKKKSIAEAMASYEEEQEFFKSLSCSELIEYLNQNWGTLLDGHRTYLASLLAYKGCLEGVPYLLRQLKSGDPFSRWRALSGLAELKCLEHRQVFIDFHLNDPDEEVRQTALIHFSTMFRNQRDIEILRLALGVWDDPSNSVAMRLTAGAAMMYQLDVPHDERGAPAWWNEEGQDLQHPSILRAVEETRQLLAQEKLK